MLSYKSFFKGKKVLVVGLGANCEAVADIAFLVKAGAEVSMIDMRSEARIDSAVKKIQALGMVQCEFGTMARGHIEGKDLIIKALDVPYDVPCIEEAIYQGIPVEISSTLCLKLVPQIILIGVFGMCGKSTTTHIIHKILSPQFTEKDGQKLWLMDQQSASPLTILKKAKKGDIILTSILEEQYEAYTKGHISPHVAVVTNPTKLKLLELQTYNNFLVANDATVDAIKDSKTIIKSKILRTNGAYIPSGWSVHQPSFMKENMALALRVAELFKVDFDDIQILFETFKPLKGRLELCRSNIYNDSASVRPHSTITALKTIGGEKDIILILGGGAIKDDIYDLFKIIQQYVAELILIPGSGTMKLHQTDIPSTYTLSVEEAVATARSIAQGRKILFSPGFAPLTTVKERHEQFLKAIKRL